MVGAFGKIPKAGDFVRLGAQSEVTRGFEEWLHQGVQVAHDKRGSSWKATFLGGGTYAFVARVPLNGNANELGRMAGVVRPSHDSVGRAFPFVVYTLLPEAVAPYLLPQALGSFLDDAASAAFASENASAAEIEQRLRSIAPVADAHQILPAYDHWAHTTRLSSLWHDIYGTADSTHGAYCLYLLTEMAKPFRGQAHLTTPLALRVPLGRAGVLAAGFWIDVVRSALQWNLGGSAGGSTTSLSNATGVRTPTFFWYFDGYRGDVIIQLGRTPPSSLVELWWPDPRNEAMTDLLQAKPWGDSLARLPTHVRIVLERSHSTVAELVAALGY